MNSIDSLSGMLPQAVRQNPSFEVFQQAEEAPGSGESFSKFLGNSINEVNQSLQTADKLNQDMVAGKSENLHEVMIAGEKAETSLKLMMQVRNKAIEAYNEVMRMQF